MPFAGHIWQLPESAQSRQPDAFITQVCFAFVAVQRVAPAVQVSLQARHVVEVAQAPCMHVVGGPQSRQPVAALEQLRSWPLLQEVAPAAGHASVHAGTHVAAPLQTWPGLQRIGRLQVRQPSSPSTHALTASPTHVAVPVVQVSVQGGMQSPGGSQAVPSAQLPQVPPQPSEPQTLPAHRGVQPASGGRTSSSRATSRGEPQAARMIAP